MKIVKVEENFPRSLTIEGELADEEADFFQDLRDMAIKEIEKRNNEKETDR